jgi:hypothetical protein
MAMLNESNLLAMKAKAAKFRTHHIGTKLNETELRDMDVLSKHDYDGKKSGQKELRAGSSRPQVGGVSDVVKTLASPISIGLPDDAEFEVEESTYRGANQNGHHVVMMAGGK